MELTKQEFQLFRSLIYHNCGLVIPDDKEYLIRQRLEPLAKAENCLSFGEFYLKLKSDILKGCIMKVIEAITTHETSFFRDSHPYRAFAESIMPELVRKLESRKRLTGGRLKPKIRIWSAASSTGQEPYSIAMLICEHFEKRLSQGISSENFDILATDISRESLAQSMLGEYSKLEANRGLSEARKNRFFTLEGECWVAKDFLREMIEFRQFNLIENIRTLGVFDVIFCRNVLIYFDDATKKRILGAMHQMLDREGLLVLGSMESTYNLTDRFEMVKSGDTILYRPKLGTTANP